MIELPRILSRLLGFLALLLILVAGCFPIGVDTQPTDSPLLRPRPELFDVPKSDPPEVVTPSPDEVTAIFGADPRIPGRRETLSAHFRRQRPRDEANAAPVIIVLPMMGGRYLLSRYLADRIFEGGFSVLRLERRGPLAGRDGGLTSAREALRGAVIDVRRSLDWLIERGDAISGRVGLLGVSAGGIVGSLVIGIDERIEAASLLLAGGNLTEMVLHSDEAGLGRLKSASSKARPLIRSWFDTMMPELLASLDPLAYAGRLPPDNVLFIGAAFDSVVPRRCTLALWEAWGRPRILELPAGHYTAALFLPLVVPEIVAHFERVFAARD